ncbi:hypothetical protein PIB30_058094 [Stylosanthes scabra]|uniref:Uncharacterized protein n=1 Tax=Stylosanthes scabra TaxID=79078 RepID=A0ABU6VIB9_9FABA|nr:hypothetical protein [Stylosanthes scabra]
MRITIAALLGKINHWSKQTTWETNKGSPIRILMPIPITPDGGITLTLVGEGTKIKVETTFKTVHLTLLFQRPPFPQPTTIPPPPQPKPPQANSFEAALENLTLTTAGFVQITNNFIEEARANFRNHESSIRNLETQSFLEGHF